jgi:hypothetical protein
VSKENGCALRVTCQSSVSEDAPSNLTAKCARASGKLVCPDATTPCTQRPGPGTATCTATRVQGAAPAFRLRGLSGEFSSGAPHVRRSQRGRPVLSSPRTSARVLATRRAAPSERYSGCGPPKAQSRARGSLAAASVTSSYSTITTYPVPQAGHALESCELHIDAFSGFEQSVNSTCSLTASFPYTVGSGLSKNLQVPLEQSLS